MRKSLPAVLVASFCFMVADHAASSPAPTTDAAPPAPKWLREITRIAYTDISNVQPVGDWPDKFIEDCATAKVQLLFSHAHTGDKMNGLAWKSAYGDPDPTMGGHDGTREVVALCHKHGIRYVTYYLAQRETASVAKAHPDWRCLNSKGKPTVYFCINTPYRDLIRNRIVELVKEVGVDGIFFDMFHARADECYCVACKAKFTKETGQEPPVTEDFDSLLWQQWTEFKYRSIESAMLDFNRAMKAANPEAALIVNTWNAWAYRNPHNIRNSIRVAEVADGLLEETGWYDTADPLFFAFPALHNFMSWHLGGLCQDKRAFMWSAGSYLRTGPVGYQEADIRVLTMMANDSVPAQAMPGRDVMARYVANIAARDKYFAHDRLHPWCGLVVSERTELWYGRDQPKDRYLKGVYGAFQTMMERHLPVSLVTDRDLERGKLDDFRVLFLPNCAAMSDVELETIRRFVRNGGGLVATYETSLYDEHGQPRPTIGLGDLLNAKKIGAFDSQTLGMNGNPKKPHLANFRLPPQHRWATDPVILERLSARTSTQAATGVSETIPLHCRMLLVEPLIGPASPLRINTAETDKQSGEVDRTDTVAVIESTYGKGKVIYLPADLSWAFFRFGYEHWARLLELALRDTASAPPPVEVAAPRIVQAMTHTQDGRLVIHLLNDISSLGRSQNVAGESMYERREVIPIHDIALTFRDKKLKRFTLVPGEKRLKAIATSEGLRVIVPQLDVHCMVVAE